jgi:hypothetical protein
MTARALLGPRHIVELNFEIQVQVNPAGQPKEQSCLKVYFSPCTY